MKKTITDKHIEAINLLKDVLLQNDVKDELQLEIEKWLLKNGCISKPKRIIDKTMVSKKSFRDKCDFHVYKGNGTKHNVIYFDWQENDKGRGFKYASAMDSRNGTKAELFEAMYQWVCNSIALPWYIRYRCAVNDENRFKVGISLNF